MVCVTGQVAASLLGSDAFQEADVIALSMASELISAARRPMLLVGQGALISGACQLVRELAEKAGMPVAATLLGLSAMPCEHPLYVGMLGMHGNYGPNRLTNEADVIVAVGVRFDDRVTRRLDGYAPQAKIVHIEIEPAEVVLVADRGRQARPTCPAAARRAAAARRLAPALS